MKNTIGEGIDLTMNIFADMVGSDTVKCEDVWKVVEHAMIHRKKMRGFKKVLLSNMPEDSAGALTGILESICSVGYGKFLRENYKR